MVTSSARVHVLRADAHPSHPDRQGRRSGSTLGAGPRPWSPVRLGLAGRLVIAFGGIGLVWSAIALGLA